jgi:hypothetical protein
MDSEGWHTVMYTAGTDVPMDLTAMKEQYCIGALKLYEVSDRDMNVRDGFLF